MWSQPAYMWAIVLALGKYMSNAIRLTEVPPCFKQNKQEVTEKIYERLSGFFSTCQYHHFSYTLGELWWQDLMSERVSLSSYPRHSYYGVSFQGPFFHMYTPWSIIASVSCFLSESCKVHYMSNALTHHMSHDIIPPILLYYVQTR